MTASDFIQLARMEMKQHRLIPAWSVAIVGKRWKRTLAECNPNTKTLEFSPRALSCYSVSLQIIRHEIAHALDWEERGTWRVKVQNRHHGRAWKEKCRLVKCPATRYISA